MIQNLPNIGDKLYFLQREIIVKKIYENFQLLKIQFVGESDEFFVDICAVNDIPDNTSSISLRLLRRKLN